MRFKRIKNKGPSSRARLSEEGSSWNGLFIAGVEINNKFFGKKLIRSNRHLKLCGKRETGKTYFYNLMHSAVNMDLPLDEGSVGLFLEYLDHNQRRFYAFCRSSKKKGIELLKYAP